MSSLERTATVGDRRPLSRKGDALVIRLTKWAVREYNNKGHHLIFIRLLKESVAHTMHGHDYHILLYAKNEDNNHQEEKYETRFLYSPWENQVITLINFNGPLFESTF
ncbi:hypothetical protein Csa_021377 [Cucumis sativus]|uniref:Cystatin domain-containing protein n=1 Tax=Cucumis sativus TaxID=3659 RepID=A0A0A0KIU3_CUCSA|nr:hypothetical protein Csa_021377 [Cucumis sativus]